MWAGAFIEGSMEKTGKAGTAGLGLASVSNFSGFWGTGAVSMCLVPGHAVTNAGRQWSRVREPDGGGGCGVGSGLVGLSMKGMFFLFYL